MTENIVSLAEYRDDKKGHWSGASVRQTTKCKIGDHFASVSDAPGAKPAHHPELKTLFQIAMHSDFSQVSHRQGYADLEIQDLCGVATWALFCMSGIRRGTRTEKRASPGWRDRLKALKRLEIAAFDALMDTHATMYQGVIAKLELAMTYADFKYPQKSQDMGVSARRDKSHLYVFGYAAPSAL